MAVPEIPVVRTLPATEHVPVLPAASCNRDRGLHVRRTVSVLLLRYSSVGTPPSFAKISPCTYDRDMDTTMTEANLAFMQCLFEIVCESEEPETIRKALAALTNTPGGIEYLQMNPITL